MEPGLLGLREEGAGAWPPGTGGRRAERARPGFRGPGPRVEGGIPRPLLRRRAPPRPRARPGPSGACAARNRRASGCPCSQRAGGGAAAAPGAVGGAEEDAPGKSLGVSSPGIPVSRSPCPRVGRDVGGAGGGGAWRRKLRQGKSVSDEQQVTPGEVSGVLTPSLNLLGVRISEYLGRRVLELQNSKGGGAGDLDAWV